VSLWKCWTINYYDNQTHEIHQPDVAAYIYRACRRNINCFLSESRCAADGRDGEIRALLRTAARQGFHLPECGGRGREAFRLPGSGARCEFLGDMVRPLPRGNAEP